MGRGRMLSGRGAGAGGGAAGREAFFVIDLFVPLSPHEAFRRALDLRAHDRIIPFTRVSPAVPADDLRPGFGFVARTGIGVLAFDDPMRVKSVHAGASNEPASGPTPEPEDLTADSRLATLGPCHAQFWAKSSSWWARGVWGGPWRGR